MNYSRITENFSNQITSTQDDERAECYVSQANGSRSDENSKARIVGWIVKESNTQDGQHLSDDGNACELTKEKKGH